jgi:hypothetical protein
VPAPSEIPPLQARIEAAQKKVNDLKRAIAETQRAIRDLQIAGAAAQGEAMGDVSRAAESRVKDMEVQLQARATSIDGIGKAIKGSISDEVAALEKLRLAFGDAASAGRRWTASPLRRDPRVEHLVDQLTHGVVASDKFTASVLRIADALKEAAKAAKVDPIEQFKKAVFGAEGTGPNQMGSSAAGFGQFMPRHLAQLFQPPLPRQGRSFGGRQARIPQRARRRDGSDRQGHGRLRRGDQEGRQGPHRSEPLRGAPARCGRRARSCSQLPQERQ